MYNNNITEAVSKIPKNVHIIDTKWEFTEKDENKKKARLVARGFQQIPGQGFIETYSPTIQTDSLRLTVAIASLNELEPNPIRYKSYILKCGFRRKNISENIFRE